MAATADAAGTVELAEMAEATKAAEWAAIVEAEEMKIGGGGGKPKKSSTDSESGDKAACPGC